MPCNLPAAVINLFANVDFSLTAWLCYALLGFMFTPGCDCCGEPDVPCEGCNDAWTYTDGRPIFTLHGSGDFSDELDDWAQTGAAAAWSNESNAHQSDDTYATVTLNNEQSNILKGTGATFQFTDSTQIVGLELLLEWSRVGDETVTLDSVKWIIGGAVVGNELASGEIAPAVDGSILLGGPTDLAGLTPSATDINADDFGAAIQVGTTGTNEVARIDAVQVTVYYEGASGCGFIEEAGTWEVQDFRAHTESDNALILATWTPTDADFALTFEWGIGGAGDEMRLYFNYLDASNHSYIEFKTTNSGVTEGHIRIVNVSGGVPSTLAEINDTDVGSPFVSAATMMTVDVCITPTLVYVTGAGVCLRVAGSFSETGWGFGTGVNSTGTGFDINNVTAQENGVDGDGNPCGCEVICDDCTHQEFRIDQDGWVDDDCDECDSLNTSYYVSFGCGAIALWCSSTEVQFSSICTWFKLDAFDVCNFGGQISLIIDETKVGVQSVIDAPLLDEDAWGWLKDSGFTRATDCNSLNNTSIPFHSHCRPSAQNQCDGSAVTTDVTAV